VVLEPRRAVFTYRGKSGKAQRQVVTNPELLPLVRRLMRTPGSRLFRYRERDGWCDLDATTLIAYLREHIGPFAVKDFRTWGGTLRAAIVLAELGPGKTETDTKRNVALAMPVPLLVVLDDLRELGRQLGDRTA